MTDCIQHTELKRKPVLPSLRGIVSLGLMFLSLKHIVGLSFMIIATAKDSPGDKSTLGTDKDQS